MDSGDSGWLVARTKPQQEAYAHMNIERQGYLSYLPRCLDPQTHRIKPLFTGYLFVYAVERWSWLRNTYGVLDIVFNAGNPARIADRIIKQIKAREGSNGLVALDTERFHKGESVRLRMLNSVLDGAVGLFDGRDGTKRVWVLLQMLGTQTRVSVPERRVELA